MSSGYLKINSKDRKDPLTTTPAQFTVVSRDTLSCLSLKSISLPVTYHNVAAGLNNKVYFTDTAPRVAALPPGFYTIAQLLTNLATAMTAASGSATYTCTQDELTQILSVTSTSAFTFTWSTTDSSAAEILGFANKNSAVAATTQIAGSVINLATTTCFNIVINGAVGTKTVTGANTCSFVVPALANSFDIQEYVVPITMPQTVTFSPTRHLDIGIFDDNHRLLNFCSNWYMICM